mgnify:CR=1 FL=1
MNAEYYKTMREYKFSDLLDKKDKISVDNNQDLFDKTIHIDLSLPAAPQRNKGVDTIMLECENGATLIIEKDCITNKVIAIEIFE